MAAHGPKRTKSAERPKGHVVLLVDDVTDVREVLAEILVREGFAVIEASNGHEAVVKARAARPDVIVMDIALPLLGGIEAARVIRAVENLHDVPIIALTARPVGTFDEHEFDGVLSKPCMPDVLVRRLQAVIVSRRKRYSPSGAT
jgi:two-component system alkaline phosphatase synthesis response regulator PhoP